MRLPAGNPAYGDDRPTWGDALHYMKYLVLLLLALLRLLHRTQIWASARIVVSLILQPGPGVLVEFLPRAGSVLHACPLQCCSRPGRPCLYLPLAGPVIIPLSLFVMLHEGNAWYALILTFIRTVLTYSWLL